MRTENDALWLIDRWGDRRKWTDRQKTVALCMFISEEIGMDLAEFLAEYLAKCPPVGDVKAA